MSTFSKTMKISAFAMKNSVSDIEIKKNPKTKKFFAVFHTENGQETGRIADDLKGKINDTHQVSWFAPEDGDASWMIHSEGEGAPTVSSMSFTLAPKAKVKAPVDLDEI